MTQRRVWMVGVLSVLFASAALAQVVVTSSNLNGWTPTATDGNPAPPPPQVQFVVGPGTPPLGGGSVEFQVGPDGNQAAQMRNNSYAGLLLSDLTELTYSTYWASGGSGGQTPYLILNIDRTGDGVSDDLLFFEPVYQTGAYSGDPVPNQGTVTMGVWQTWNARIGGWWIGTGGPPLVTLDNYIAANPTARIANSAAGGSVRIVTGFGAGAWDNFVGNADAFRIAFGGPTPSDTTFNFEPEPNITISDVTLAEGTGGTTNFVFTVTLSTPVSQTVNINYTTADNTATVADGDYTLTAGTLVFAPNDTSEQITVPIGTDNKFENDESFFVNLSAGSGANFGAPSDLQGVGTIQNDDLQPSIFINDVADSEAAGVLVFTVTLSNPSFEPITVGFLSLNGTAVQPDDYQATMGAITFNPGETSKPINVPVVNDAMFEPDETLTMNIPVAPPNATVADNQGLGTILNDDAQPTISIDDVTLAEGNAATTAFTFNVTLSNPSSQLISVNATAADNTATQPSDYAPAAFFVTFTPGQTTQPITVQVVGDTLPEGTETFFVNLNTPTNATILDNQGLGTIVEDDAGPTIIISDVSQPEAGGPFVFNVTLSGPSGLPITVNYTTADGTATQPGDYTLTSGMLTFVPGDVSEQISVPIINDGLFEPNETFFVNLSAPTNATILDGQGQGTIVNDDGAVADLGITKTGPASAPVGGTISYTITVTNNGPQPATNVTVSDPVPVGTTFSSATPSQGTCTPGAVVTCSLGTILNGGTATITLNVIVDGSAAPIVNTATVTATEVDPNPLNNTGSSAPAALAAGQNIPTLSEWALLLLAMALAAFAAMRLKM